MQKSAVFQWQGLDPQGNPCHGELAATTPALVNVKLRQQGIRPLKVKRRRIKPIRREPVIRPADIALFTRQLATLARAGLPLLQSLDIIAEGFEHPRMTRLIRQIHHDIAAGQTLSNALRNSGHFDGLYCSLVNVGEQSGTLERLLERIVQHQEKSARLKKLIVKALLYPSMVLMTGLIVSAVLLLKVVPQFESIFAAFGAELPMLTRSVIELARALQAHGLAGMAMLLILAAVLTFGYRRSPLWRERLQSVTLKLPLLGKLLYHSAISRYAGTLSITFAAGVPLPIALALAGDATGNIPVRLAAERLRQDVTAGVSLHQAMSNTAAFPRMAVQMTAIGEESGMLDRMLDHVADHYETVASQTVEQVLTLLEPMVIIVLGGLIGGLIVAMYLPIFRMGAVF